MKTWSYKLKGIKESRMHCLHRCQFCITTSYLQNVFIVFGDTRTLSAPQEPPLAAPLGFLATPGGCWNTSSWKWAHLLEFIGPGHVMPSGFFSPELPLSHLRPRPDPNWNRLENPFKTMAKKVGNDGCFWTTPHRPLERFHVRQWTWGAGRSCPDIASPIWNSSISGMLTLPPVLGTHLASKVKQYLENATSFALNCFNLKQ